MDTLKNKMKERKKYFKSVSSARNFQKRFKKDYGYTPSLFLKVEGTKVKSRFIVIPRGLKRKK